MWGKIIAERVATATWTPTHAVIDNLFPDDFALSLYEAFPTDDMRLRKSFRERKRVSAQMNRHSPLLERAIFSFQESEVVSALSDRLAVPKLSADPNLYAGGISVMERGDFLRPHLDNSHDMAGERWRVLNLLYYVTPDWDDDDGGALEIWTKDRCISIAPHFNRLVIMPTDGQSWHSVSKVRTDRRRCCISNYYFAPTPLRTNDRRHVTTFRPRPEHKVLAPIFAADAFARQAISRLGLRRTGHAYHTSSPVISTEKPRSVGEPATLTVVNSA